MSNAEARVLAKQLGYEVQTVAGLEVLLESKSLKIGLDLTNGNWIIANKSGEVLAQCE